MNDVEKNQGRLEFARSRLELTEPAYELPGFVAFCRDSVIHHNVIIGGNVSIGHDCLIRSGTVIGESGFSFAFDENNIPIPIRHTGGVIIGNYVNIGCNCTIMRATIENTVIEDHVQFDNLVHVAHNVKIGRGTCIADCVAISGSVEIGEQCWIGPNVSIAQSLKIGRMALIGIGANVIDDVPDYAVVSGNPAKIRYFHDGTIHPGAISRRSNA